ncbi:hypothetical protein [Burkholderia gladioli]|uniref:hypothetical protein n=1 Tax=Burkholderia gladioli TaxID=28095 RepID=UPI00163FBE49|nr:hypothetical protein [Burkholderia gladioli]
MQFGLQLRHRHTGSNTLGRVIAFLVVDEKRAIYEAVINEHVLAQIATALAKLPHKIRCNCNGTDWEAWKCVNNPGW